jgi:hypothetical protein
MATNAEMYQKCMEIEAMITSMVVCGITDNKKLVEAVNAKFTPKTEWEMELYSEAIIYAKQAVLN